MNNTLVIYIKQRFNLAVFLGLSGYLLLFAQGIDISLRNFVPLCCLLFCCLLSFRLYDDLQQYQSDQQKPNRDYTKEIVRSRLIYYNLGLFILSIGLGTYIHRNIGLTILGFALFNHILYLIFLDKGALKTILPLLKYPFLLALAMPSLFFDGITVNIQQWPLLLSIFFAFIRIESLNDVHFILHKRQTIIFEIACFTLLLYRNLNAQSIAFSLALYAISRWLQYKQVTSKDYFLLLLLLTEKLTLQYYEF